MQGYGQPVGAAYQPPGMAAAGYPAAEEKKKKSKVPILVFIFALLCVIMMGIALALPWYVYTTDGDPYARATLTGTETKIIDPSTLEETTESKAWGDMEGVDAQKGVYNLALIMTVLGLVLAILLLIGAILAMKGKGKQYVFLFGLLALIFCLLAPVIFMASHAGAVAEDFKENTGVEPEGPGSHDSFSGSEGAVGWGPSSGFYMTIIGFIFALLAFILSFKIPKPELTLPTQPQAQERAPMPMAVQQTAGYPGYQGYPQQQMYPPQQPPV